MKQFSDHQLELILCAAEDYRAHKDAWTEGRTIASIEFFTFHYSIKCANGQRYFGDANNNGDDFKISAEEFFWVGSLVSL